MATRKRKLSAKEVGKCHPKQSRGRKGGKGRCLPRSVLKRLSPVAAECENGSAEHCMLDKIPSTVIPDAEKERLRKDYLRPRYPNEWLKDEDQWLDNFQIASVMKQYEEAYPWFRFMGALPIDFSAPDPYLADKTKQQCMHPEMCALNLKNEYERGIRAIGIIFNLDPHFKGGSHWVGLYIDIHNLAKPIVGYSDSYGFKPPRLIARLMKSLKLQAPAITLSFNARRFQKSNSECGMYSLYFIICMIHGIPFAQFCKDSVPDSFMLELRKVLFAK
jgi:hypothetical protein